MFLFNRAVKCANAFSRLDYLVTAFLTCNIRLYPAISAAWYVSITLFSYLPVIESK